MASSAQAELDERLLIVWLPDESAEEHSEMLSFCDTTSSCTKEERSFKLLPQI